MATIQCKNLTFTNIEAIIFDKDGTLEDSEVYLRSLGQRRSRIIDAQVPGTSEPLLMAFGINGNTLDPTGMLAVASRHESEIAAAAYIAETGKGWLESLEIARRAFTEADNFIGTAPSPLFMGSLEVLINLSQAGLKLGILSAASTDRVRSFVQTHQLSDYIQLQMGTIPGGISKPNPALFMQACQTLGVEPSNTLMVGDSIGDIKMAREAKAAGCIGICWNQAATHLQSADVTISHLEEIKLIVKP
ncbi:HAD family hydrolase [Synechocystis sp. PCC 7509]|uniref:HAD family hydrolase n=1 Tax=Synechocystis sp. PCC 7509 TaxID=927677 RepID=UPI00048B9D2B|nr:HAD family hydrolase [Synechocystis sp. PCC 7509]